MSRYDAALARGRQARCEAAEAAGHWTPDEPYGWFWVEIQAPLCGTDKYPLFIPFSALLWWNEDSPDGGWWIGRPGRTVALGALLPGAQVLAPSEQELPKRSQP